MSRRLEVFEHEKLEVGARLTPHEFDALVAWNDRFEGRYFRVGHRHLRARHFVGIVQVGDLAIEIVPKADRDGPLNSQPWREGLLEMLRVGGSLKLERLPAASQRLSRRPLQELIARAYLAEVEGLLHEGLAKGYRTVEDNRPVFRGRLLVAKHVRANVVRADRFYVEHTVFDHHVAINRVILAALEVLAHSALSPPLRTAIAACAGRFPELSTAGVDAAMCDRLHLGRATQRYAGALVYARLILSHQGPALRFGRDRVFALLFDMNTLWERYVAALVRRAVPEGFTVATQDRLPFWTPVAVARTVRPDIIVRDRAARTQLVIDTKWKVADAPDDADLKQMFVYNELLGCTRSLLVYPRTVRAQALSGRYTGRDHGCEQAHLGVIDGEHWRSTALMVEQLRQLLGAEVPASGTHAHASR